MSCYQVTDSNGVQQSLFVFALSYKANESTEARFPPSCVCARARECACVCVGLQGIGAELGLQESSSLQEENRDVKGVDVRVGRGSSGHQFP